MFGLRLLGGLAALGIVAGAVGAAVTFATGGLDGTGILATLAFVALVVGVLAAAGARGGAWISTPYW